MNSGYFISFEGGEGAGKSTQVRRLAARLSGLGREVVATREPGGSPGAETIRDLVVNGAVDRWSPLSETLLFYAARANHLETLIVPALSRGAVVICDRFSDSTKAYQGAAGGVDVTLIDALERQVVGDSKPDLTIILDMPVETGLARAATRGEGEARFEAKGRDFHHRLRQAFLDIAALEPGRHRVLDAAMSADDVELEVWRQVSKMMGL